MRNPSKANYKFVLKDWTALPDLDAMARVLETKRFSQNLAPVLMESLGAQRILVISPHPDDDVLSSGGLLLKSIAQGAVVKVVYVTSAANPTYEDDSRTLLTPAAATIERETRMVAEQLGTEIEFWRYDKRAIPSSGSIIERFRATLREFRPDTLFLPFLSDDHGDHRHCNRVLLEAARHLDNTDFEIWAYQVYATVLPNVVVDVTDVMERKMALINLWESQKKSRDWAHYIRGLNAFNCRFLKTNEARYAETFFVVPCDEYLSLCRRYYERISDGETSSKL